MYISIGILSIVILAVAIYMTITIANNQTEEGYQRPTMDRFKRLLVFYLLGGLLGLVIYILFRQP